MIPHRDPRKRLNGCPQGRSNGEPSPTRSRGADRQNSKKLLGSERCNDAAPHLKPRLLTFELAPGLPATTVVVELKIPQSHRVNSLSPCRTQLGHQQFTDRSSRLRSVVTVAAFDYRRMSVAVRQKPLSRHKRSLGHLRRTSQIHPREDRALHRIANIQRAPPE